MLGTLLLVLIPFAAPPTAQDGSSPPLPTGPEIQALMTARDWDAAIGALERVVEAQPQNAGAWFQLGYSLHMRGDLARAHDAHLKAAELGGTMRPTALYNHACSHALLDEPEKALEALTEAVDAGFANAAQVRTDPDLASLREDGRYRRLLERLDGSPAAAPAATSTDDARPSGETIDVAALPAERRFDFRVGDWDKSIRGVVYERETVEPILGGAALMVRSTAVPTGAETNRSFLVHVRPPGEWRQTWISARGHHDVLTGGLRDGALILDQPVLRDRPGSIGRLVYRNVTTDSFEAHWEVSTDAGITWNLEAPIHFQRR